MRAPILARGRGPTARGRCHLSRPRGSQREACREVPRTLHPLHPLSIARNFPTRRAVGGVGAVLPAFVFSGLYGPARQLPPATLSARHVEDDRRCEDHEQRELHPLIEVALHKAQGMRTSRDSLPQKSEGDWVTTSFTQPPSRASHAHFRYPTTEGAPTAQRMSAPGSSSTSIPSFQRSGEGVSLSRLANSRSGQSLRS